MLNYPEREIWHMTLRKFTLLYVEHLKQHGAYQEPQTIDEVFA
jgi:hypothetical protein